MSGTTLIVLPVSSPEFSNHPMRYFYFPYTLKIEICNKEKIIIDSKKCDTCLHLRLGYFLTGNALVKSKITYKIYRYGLVDKGSINFGSLPSATAGCDMEFSVVLVNLTSRWSAPSSEMRLFDELKYSRPFDFMKEGLTRIKFYPEKIDDIKEVSYGVKLILPKREYPYTQEIIYSSYDGEIEKILDFQITDEVLMYSSIVFAFHSVKLKGKMVRKMSLLSLLWKTHSIVNLDLCFILKKTKVEGTVKIVEVALSETNDK